MNEITRLLSEIFQASPAAPFLFVGSGFSRRYLGLEDWSALLKRFSAGLREYEYYFSSASGDLPSAASLIAEDFHDHWWRAPEFAKSREKHSGKIRDRTSALRVEICDYINSISFPKFDGTPYAGEIEILSRLNVDGVITTNWDGLVEHLFPDYRVFVGQAELLFANPQSIAEIYKIHGSSSRPGSLVLTKQDYEEFERNNPYLAAKLITVFVEHPIVFLGYSLSDKNISALLRSIVNCLGSDNLEKLRSNLIFVQRASGSPESIAQTSMTIDGMQLPITLVKTDDFRNVYLAMEAMRRKIPARVLRFCKEELYQLVKARDGDKKLSVVGVDDLESRSDVEFVVGIGVASNHVTSDVGYQGLAAIDLFKDVLEDSSCFDAHQVVHGTLPALLRNCKYLPFQKYRSQLGLSMAKFQELIPSLNVLTSRKPDDFTTSQYARQFVRNWRGKSAADIIAGNPAEKAAILLPFLTADSFDLEVIREFLRVNVAKVESSNSSYSTFFRKLFALYDCRKFGIQG